jgi:hypothetical protein
MKFSQYSIIQFCESVYDLYELPFGSDKISSVEMYQFIKEKSNDFDLKCFEYLILDIRNFQNSIQFQVKNPEPMPEFEIDPDTGYPCSANEELRYNYQHYLKYDLASVVLDIAFDIDLRFTDNQTLRERVELFRKSLPQASIIHDITNLLRFSDIAEKEYARIIESSKITPNNIIQLKLEENHTTNSALQEKPIIKQPEQAQINDEINYNATPAEFCSMLYKLHDRHSFDDDVTPSQMEKYIKSVTKNYNKPDFEYLLSEIRNFAHKIQILIPKPENEIIKKNDDNENDRFEENKYKYYDTDPITLSILFNIESEVDEQETLREKIRTLKNHIPEAKFKPGLTGLLTFSEMAEKQFEKRTQTEHYNSNDITEEKQIRITTSAKNTDIITNKKYLDLTPLDFCTFLYKPRTGLEEKEYFESDYLARKNEEISDHMLYQYIKHNTNNFDKKSFDYLIADIRNYVYQITFHLPEIHQDGTDYYSGFDFEQDYWGNIIMTDDYYFGVIFNQPEFTIETIGSWDGASGSMYTMRYHIPDNLTLKERHELILDKIPLATFRYGIDNLLHFSEFAEDEYAKIKGQKTSKSSTSQNKTENIQTDAKLSHAHIALICFYQGIAINKQNGDEILLKYNGTGGQKKLIEKYNFYIRRENRVLCDETKSDLAKQKRLIEVIDFLNRNNLNSEPATKELNELEKNMNI